MIRALAGGGAHPDGVPEESLREAGFVVADDAEEEILRAPALADFRGALERTPTQLLFVPTLGCNLRCTYCYQELLDVGEKGLVSPEVVAAFFAWVDRHPEDRGALFATLALLFEGFTHEAASAGPPAPR